MGSIITGYLDSIPEEIKNPLAEFKKETEKAKRAERSVHHIERNVHHPAHYGGADNVYEAINVIEAYDMGFLDGNVLKYLLRYKKKNGLEDLKKAKWYLERLITNIENE